MRRAKGRNPWLYLSLWVSVGATCPRPSAAQESANDRVETALVRAGDLEILFRDNSRSPEILSGIQSLFNVKDAPGFDAFDPDVLGASAGLNFEHIISGHRNAANAFSPL